MKKRIGSIITVSLLCFTSLVSIFSPSYVLANNHIDWRFSRYMVHSDGDAITPFREKLDYSSSYTYNDKSAGSYYAKGVGSNNARFYSYDCVIDIKKCLVGHAYYIRQNVKEKGYKYGALELAPSFEGLLSMLWSPDSV